jgi:hypothetical protein
MRVVAKLSSLVFVLMAFTALAQNDLITEPTLLYRKRLQYGFNLNSSTLGGLNFKYQWQKTALLKNGFDVELARIRHPKEERVYGQSDNPKQYTPGRVNMAFFLRTGYGQNVFITTRDYKNAVSLHYNYSFGVTTALLKPIYIDVFKLSQDPFGQDYIATEKYDPVDKHTTPFIIYGNSAFSRGFNELSAQVGGHFKNSLSIEWGEYPDAFNSLEAGFCIDVFAQPLPLMADELARNKQLYFTLFLGFTFGQNR